MSRRVVIDSLVFAREGRSLQGELPVSSLTRILDVLADQAGELRYRVQGQMGPRRRPQLLLEVDGRLSLRCQRCLEGIDYPVRVRSVLELISNEEDLTQEEIEDDSKDFLPAEKTLDVVALIEDELILELPTAPRHESCALPDTRQEKTDASPFSLLKGFKGKAS